MDSLKEADWPSLTPDPQGPALTALDIDRAKGAYQMNLPMSSPCERCGGFNMRVGDYVCWGVCYRCTVSDYDSSGV